MYAGGRDVVRSSTGAFILAVGVLVGDEDREGTLVERVIGKGPGSDFGVTDQCTPVG